jgi:hypothetical protein
MRGGNWESGHIPGSGTLAFFATVENFWALWNKVKGILDKLESAKGKLCSPISAGHIEAKALVRGAVQVISPLSADKEDVPHEFPLPSVTGERECSGLLLGVTFKVCPCRRRR